MEQNKQNNSTPQGTGRISNIHGQDKDPQNRDISCIDQQEGEMDHGETGGNFQPPNREGSGRQERE